MQTCIICGGGVKAERDTYDDRYGYPGMYTLFCCESCGHRTLDAIFSDRKLTAMYTDYYPRSNFSLEKFTPHKERTGLAAWLDGSKSFAFRWVPKNVRIIDIGCGFGETLGYHKARGCDVCGVEADENIKRVADKYGFKVDVGLFDTSKYAPESFDYVTMDQVIEHVIDPLRMLSDIEKILRPGGYVIIGTPNANGWGAFLFRARWISWHIPYHLQFFSKKSIQAAADKTGFSVERVSTITSSDYLYAQWNHLFFRPKEGSRSIFWSSDALPSRMQKYFMKILFRFHQLRVNHIITRLFDFFGVGDNYIIILRKRGHASSAIRSR